MRRISLLLVPRSARRSDGTNAALVGLQLFGKVVILLRVDFEKVVQHDHQHRGAAEEDGQRV